MHSLYRIKRDNWVAAFKKRDAAWDNVRPFTLGEYEKEKRKQNTTKKKEKP